MTIHRIQLATASLLGFAILASPAILSAQALQNSTGVLPPTQQTQNTQNLNQTGSVQDQQTGQVFNQNGSRPLGVVGDPKQQTPTNVVQPSADLTSGAPVNLDNKSFPYWIAFVVLVIIGFIVFAIQITSEGPTRQKATKPNFEPKPKSSAAVAPKPEVITPKKTKKKQTRRQRSKKR